MSEKSMIAVVQGIDSTGWAGMRRSLIMLW